MTKILELLLHYIPAPYAFILFFLIPGIVISIPAWIFLKKQNCLTLWEIGLPLYGIFFWYVSLAIIGGMEIRGESLANLFYEPLMMTIFSVVLIYLRAFILYRYFENQKNLVLLLLFILALFAFLLRLFMPMLAE